VVATTKTLEVPKVEGRTVQDAIVMLESRGLVVMPPHEQFSDKVQAGKVISQMPYAGATVKEGRRIYITVSKGVETATMPDLRGRRVREARLALLRLGMQLGDVMYQYNDSVAAETIISQSIPPGTKVTNNSSPRVSVSQGPIAVHVPELVGRSLTEARQALQDSGLVVGQVRRISSTLFTPNTVVDTDPPAQSPVQPGTAIGLVVSE
jgi:serine/threonine-protein kinase